MPTHYAPVLEAVMSRQKHEIAPLGKKNRPSPKPLKSKVCCIQVRFSCLALRLVDLRPAWLVNRRTAV
jgi:hypothetical protein